MNIINQSEQQEKVLSKYYQKGMFQKAENLAKSITESCPSHQYAWKLLGVLYFKSRNIIDALNACKKAIELDRKDPEAYNNIGLVFLHLDKLQNADMCFNFATKLDNNFADSYFNLGITKKKMGKFEEALINYKKAIDLQPQNENFHNNLANTLLDLGRIKETVASLVKAIEINPNFTRAWNNIYFPLKIIDVGDNLSKNNLYTSLKKTKFNLNNLRLSILEFKINEGGIKSKYFFEKALETINKTKNLYIKNPTNSNNYEKAITPLPKQIIALLHFGRSGTGLLHSLIDGHSQVSTLPSIYFSEFFDGYTWDKIVEGGWSEMIEKFILSYPVFFDSRSPDSVNSINMKTTHSLGIQEGMTNLGKNKDEYLYIDKSLFMKELKTLMCQHDTIDQLVFFKMIHSAFERALGNINYKNTIFYHIHNPDTYAKLNFLRLCPDSKWLMMVRNPVDSCESWISSSYNNNNYNDIAMRIKTMLFDVDNIAFRNRNSIGVRLEDLKSKPKDTIIKICNWIGIEDEKSLFKMTAQGKAWWGDKSSPTLSAFGSMPKSKFGEVFSNNDRFVLETLFYPFSVSFGYAKEDKKKFKNDLKKIRPKIDNMFDFEKKIAEKNKISPKQFMKTTNFLYLHSMMTERWQTLNEYYTYPEMLRPLKW